LTQMISSSIIKMVWVETRISISETSLIKPAKLIPLILSPARNTKKKPYRKVCELNSRFKKQECGLPTKFGTNFSSPLLEKPSLVHSISNGERYPKLAIVAFVIVPMLYSFDLSIRTI